MRALSIAAAAAAAWGAAAAGTEYEAVTAPGLGVTLEVPAAYAVTESGAEGGTRLLRLTWAAGDAVSLEVTVSARDAPGGALVVEAALAERARGRLEGWELDGAALKAGELKRLGADEGFAASFAAGDRCSDVLYLAAASRHYRVEVSYPAAPAGAWGDVSQHIRDTFRVLPAAAETPSPGVAPAGKE